MRVVKSMVFGDYMVIFIALILGPTRDFMLNSPTKVFFGKKAMDAENLGALVAEKSERCSQCKPDRIAEGDRRLSFADKF